MRDTNTVIKIVSDLLEDGYVDAAKHTLKSTIKEIEAEEKTNKVVMRPKLKDPQPPQFEE